MTEEEKRVADQKLKAYDFAQESLKQVLTLATASIGGAIALLDKADQPGIDFGAHATLVFWGLGLLVGSVASGLLGLFNLAGTLDTPPATGITIYKGSIQFFWGGQLLLFVVGLGLLIWSIA